MRELRASTQGEGNQDQQQNTLNLLHRENPNRIPAQGWSSASTLRKIWSTAIDDPTT